MFYETQDVHHPVGTSQVLDVCCGYQLPVSLTVNVEMAVAAAAEVVAPVFVLSCGAGVLLLMATACKVPDPHPHQDAFCLWQESLQCSPLSLQMLHKIHEPLTCKSRPE